MNKTKTAQANIIMSDAKGLQIEFNRFGEKGKIRSKEYFWLSRAGAFTLEDLKTIVKEAEELLKLVD